MYAKVLQPMVRVFSHFSHVQLFVSLGTAAHQPPLSKDFPGKNTGMGCHALLQGSSWPRDSSRVFTSPAFGRWVLYHQRHLGNPISLHNDLKLIYLVGSSLELCLGLDFPQKKAITEGIWINVNLGEWKKEGIGANKGYIMKQGTVIGSLSSSGVCHLLGEILGALAKYTSQSPLTQSWKNLNIYPPISISH